MATNGLNRRALLKAGLILPLLLWRLASVARAGAGESRDAPGVASARDRILLLVELHGGNDGLNTLVPYEDAAYYRARPQLAIRRDQVRQLTPKVGLHPALAPLMPLWGGEELAWVQGVGYPRPNRSHFRSIEIWDTASDSEQVLDQGWLSGLFKRSPLPARFMAEGIVLGKGDAGPLSGGKGRTIALHDPIQFLRQAGSVKPVSLPARNRSLAHILEVRWDISQAANDLQGRIQQVPLAGPEFPVHRFGKQVELAARLIAAKVPVAVIKITPGSFDTHAGQSATHHRLLEELAQGLVAFRAAMEQQGLWRDVLVMTYSEFGRRVAENASHGTDHGTAAPHLLMGGRVKGGLYGTPPSLTELQDSDLTHTVDFRSLYATVVEKWWGMSPLLFGGQRQSPVECLR